SAWLRRWASSGSQRFCRRQSSISASSSKGADMFDLSSTTAKAVFTFTLLLIAFFLFFPVYWMITSSLKADAELYRIIPSAFPEQITFKHYWTAITQGRLPLYLLNSLITSGASAALNTLLALYAAYSFAKYEYFGRRPIMLLMLSAQ